MPRLVSLDDYRLEAYLDGCLLVFRHQDVPGIIGSVGTVFGQHGVNIAQMAVGRAQPGRRGRRHLESRRRTAGRGPGGRPPAAGHHVGHGRPAAAGRPIAPLAARVELLRSHPADAKAANSLQRRTRPDLPGLLAGGLRLYPAAKLCRSKVASDRADVRLWHTDCCHSASPGRSISRRGADIRPTRRRPSDLDSRGRGSHRRGPDQNPENNRRRPAPARKP